MRWTTDLTLIERALDAIEQREIRLLVWGLVDGALAEDELRQILRDVLDASTAELSDPSCSILQEADLFARLVEQQLLIELPSAKKYRSRMAEGIRLIARLRQLFPKHGKPDGWLSAPTLVADYRLLWRRRRYPRRDITISSALDAVSSHGVSPACAEVLRHRLAKEPDNWRLARFQVDATARILEGLASGRRQGTMVAAGTGSGKTLAFYLPSLAWLANEILERPNARGVRILALYPRNELLKDQFAEVYDQCRKVDDLLSRRGSRKLTLGVLYGDTPQNLRALRSARRSWEQDGPNHRCPYLRCPHAGCDGSMILDATDREAERGRLHCSICGRSIEPDEVRLSRESMQEDPPDILFTSVEMLNQRMSDSQMRHLFGLGPRATEVPRLVLLDEVHVYSGTYGAQVAYLLRRWSTLTRHRASFVGLSATIAEGASFFAALTGLDESIVGELSPEPEEMVSEGAEYLIALRGDPTSRTALLSTSIQAAMVGTRLLDPQHLVPRRPFAGWRAFAFTDQMDATNRLFLNLLDAEGRKADGTVDMRRHPNGGLAHLRQPGPSRRRYEAGQDWRLCRDIGHQLTARHRVARTTSYDKGVSATSEVVVATSALEIGYDDPSVGLVLQHKAPRDLAQFVQRKGRAGRTRHMRPWTVMVLSDYGRDRLAYQAYEQFFDPALPPRALPLSNRYVLRMQAVYGLLDYLGLEMQQGEPSGWVWRDLSGPVRLNAREILISKCGPALREIARTARYPLQISEWKHLRKQALDATATMPDGAKWDGVNWLTNRVRRAKLVSLLSAALTESTALSNLTSFLRNALDLRDAEVQSLMWHHPRPLLLTVVPTALRRLATEWRADGAERADLQQRQPLPEFAPGALFNDLNLPEVQISRPDGTADEEVSLPVLQALNEFAPGRVSRRFDRSLWLGPTGDELASLAKREGEIEIDADIGAWFDTEPQPAFRGAGREGPIRHAAFRPFNLKLSATPFGVGDTSNARLQWVSQLFSRHAPVTYGPASHIGICALFGDVLFHTHAAHTPATIRRYARTSKAQLRVKQGARVQELDATFRFVKDGEPCGVGFEMEADAVVFKLHLPDALHRAIDWDDPSRLRTARLGRYLWEADRGDALAAIVRNPFLRDRLARIFLTAVCLRAVRRNEPVVRAIEGVASGQDQALVAEVLDAAFQSSDPSDVSTEDDSGATTDRLRNDLQQLFERNDVREALATTAESLYEPVSSKWESWLRVAVKRTLAAAILEAIQQMCPEVPVDELDVDTDSGQDEDAQSHDRDELWVSESSPGGNGLIEQVLDAYVAEPERFFRLVELALGPSDFEVTDAQMRQVVATLAADDIDDELTRWTAQIRVAASTGQIDAAFAALRRTLRERGFSVFHSFVAALGSRLLRPGMPSRLDRVLDTTLTRWDALESSLGVEVDARIAATLFSDSDDIDSALSELGAELPPGGARRTWRAGVVYGLLWARGQSLRSSVLRCPSQFEESESATDRLLVGQWLSQKGRPILASAPDWRQQFAATMAERGVASVLVDSADGNTITEIVAHAVIEPIQLDYLNLYARLAAVTRTGKALELQFRLPEGT